MWQYRAWVVTIEWTATRSKSLTWSRNAVASTGFAVWIMRRAMNRTRCGGWLIKASATHMKGTGLKRWIVEAPIIIRRRPSTKLKARKSLVSHKTHPTLASSPLNKKCIKACFRPNMSQRSPLTKISIVFSQKETDWWSLNNNRSEKNNCKRGNSHVSRMNSSRREETGTHRTNNWVTNGKTCWPHKRKKPLRPRRLFVKEIVWRVWPSMATRSCSHPPLSVTKKMRN